MIIQAAKEEIMTVIEKSFAKLIKQYDAEDVNIPQYIVEIPADTSNGDFASNVAMVSAKALRMSPQKIANELISQFEYEGTYIKTAQSAGPGFINFFLDEKWFADVVGIALKEGEKYGNSEYGGNKKVMVEFVSANPTGPMHMGNARGGSLGDSLCTAMQAAGYDVTREFYVNDAGNQIHRFALSLESRYLQIYDAGIEFPEDGYHGEDVKTLAKQFSEIHGEKYVNELAEIRQKALVDYALPINVENLKSDLEKYKIIYDVWFFESELHKDGSLDKIISLLKSKGLTYEKEGAIWYKASEFGGEKDEVLVRANGFPTYFTADIAYHYNKFVVRGFEKVINIWGADHHGHVARLKGAMDAIGVGQDKLDILLMQFVRLIKDGEPVKMSKRTGKAVTLTDLIEEVPVDAARFFFNMREPNAMLDFDLDLAIEQSSQNPVYYIQYAHARISSIISNMKAEGIEMDNNSEAQMSLLTAPEEIALIRQVAMLPVEIINVAKNYDPTKLTQYAISVAAAFHRFYNTCKVSGTEKNLQYARLSLCKATQYTIKNTLKILSVEAPEIM